MYNRLFRMHKQIDPNRLSDKIYGESYCHILRSHTGHITDICIPMNDIMWYQGMIFDAKSVTTFNMRYLDYKEMINDSTRPFKKY